jgi:hypothetical protein
MLAPNSPCENRTGYRRYGQIRLVMTSRVFAGHFTEARAQGEPANRTFERETLADTGTFNSGVVVHVYHRSPSEAGIVRCRSASSRWT